jgi:hypothetical protein
VQTATQLPYAAFLLTEQFIILYGLLTYPIWQYVTIFCGEPQKTVLTRTIKTHWMKLRNYKEQSISNCKIRTSKRFKWFVHQMSSKSVSWTKSFEIPALTHLKSYYITQSVTVECMTRFVDSMCRLHNQLLDTL